MIESYKNIEINKDNYYKVNDEVTFINSKDEKLLIKYGDEYKFKIDFNKNTSSIKLNDYNYEAEINVKKSLVKIKNNIIIIEYELETDECLNKIIITRRDDNNEK